MNEENIEKSTEPTSEQTPETVSSGVVSEDILAQQPLMAALLQEPETVPETAPVTQSEMVPETTPNASQPIEQVDPVLQTEMVNKPEESTSMNEIANLVQEKGSNQLESSSDNNEKTKKKFNIKSILKVIIVAILIIGGYFGFKIYQKMKDDKIPKIVTLEDAKNYYEDNYEFLFTDNSSKIPNTFKSIVKDESITIYYEDEDDQKELKKIIIVTKDDYSRLLKLAKPFWKDEISEEQMKKVISLVKKYKCVQYFSNNYSYNINARSQPSFEISFNHRDAEKINSSVKIKNDNEIMIENDNGGYSIKDFGEFEDNSLSTVTIDANLHSNGVSFEYLHGDLLMLSVRYVEEDLSKIVKDKKYEVTTELDYNGQKVYKVSYDLITKIWIPFDGEDVDISTSEVKKYLEVDYGSENSYDNEVLKLIEKVK